AAGSIHPGSTGGYQATMTRYDVMGRVMQQTNPTEMTGQWLATGDEAAGWQYNQPTEYDWKSRPTKTYNMNGSYKTFEYAGCGCAGGEVVTLTDEGTIVNGQAVARQQKIYSDVLGVFNRP